MLFFFVERSGDGICQWSMGVQIPGEFNKRTAKSNSELCGKIAGSTKDVATKTGAR